MTMAQVLCELGIDPDSPPPASLDEIVKKQQVKRTKIFDDLFAKQGWPAASLAARDMGNVAELLSGMGHRVPVEVLGEFVNEYVAAATLPTA